MKLNALTEVKGHNHNLLTEAPNDLFVSENMTSAALHALVHSQKLIPLTSAASRV